MIVRLVHMSFHHEKVSQFLELFENYKSQISSSPGCIGVRLIQEIDNPGKISTLSYWDSAGDLENYRKSSIFAEVWPKTKIMFNDRPHAVTHNVLSDL